MASTTKSTAGTEQARTAPSAANDQTPCSTPSAHSAHQASGVLSARIETLPEIQNNSDFPPRPLHAFNNVVLHHSNTKCCGSSTNHFRIDNRHLTNKSQTRYCDQATGQVTEEPKVRYRLRQWDALLCPRLRALGTTLQRIQRVLSELHEIWGFHRLVNETCALTEFYATYVGSSLLTFRAHHRVPSSPTPFPT